jgi:uncharacterized integral membrane protein (TIGR00698 family)
MLCVIPSVLAWYAAALPWNRSLQLSALTLAIVAGMVLGNAGLGERLSRLTPGIQFSQQKLLRAGIVLYGLRLTVEDVIRLGPVALVIDLTVIATILLAGYWFGTRVLKMDPDTTLLVCAGSGICGAAAVLATGRVTESESHKVSIAVATVVMFGTVAMFLYPLLYPLTGFGERQFGIYIGATVHEVAHVVAAGRSVGAQTMDTAVVTKMLRVLLLAPVLIVVGQVRRSKAKSTTGPSQASRSFPWFVLGFAGVIVFQSVAGLTADIRKPLLELDTILLASAMFALGLGTQWSKVKSAGTRPVVLGLVLFGTLIVEGFGLSSMLIR